MKETLDKEVYYSGVEIMKTNPFATIEPESVKFRHRLGLYYVSSSPFRLSIARFGFSASWPAEVNSLKE